MRWISVLAMLLIAFIPAGCARKLIKPEPAPAPIDDSARKLALLVTPGMTREAVEAVLGDATHQGEAKGGDIHCLYRIGETWRSVFYDKTGKVADRSAPVEIPPNTAQPRGALTGASIFVSPGHGWFSGDTAWTTQRGLKLGLIEDHSNAEAVLQYLVPYLWNAGARVYTARERDMNSNMAIVEVGAAGFSATGAWNSERTDGAWRGLQYTVETVATNPTATATFTPTIPEDGYYAVYAWYRPALDGNTATDAHFQIRHTGGTTTWRQNLNLDGYTWKYLGTYYFEAGTNSNKGAVLLDNAATHAGQRLSISAIRFGGGMGDAIRDSAPSGKPRYEESGRYYAEFMGYPLRRDTRVYNTVSAMPMWAEWEMEPWEAGKSIYVAWHTNASADGKSRGLFSFIYGPNEWGPPTEFTGVPKGLELGAIVHDRIMKEVHEVYDPQWRNGSKICRWLGETNPRNNNLMPAALFEYGFHDNPEDAAYIADPKFRDAAARATYHGILKFYTEHMDGFTTATLLPERPTNLRVLNLGDGIVNIEWDAPPFGDGQGNLGDAATGYRVYRSDNGKGFNNGFDTTEPRIKARAPRPGATTYFRVTSTNAGGESFPTETLAVRSTKSGKPDILIVNGFDRLDSDMNLDVGGNRRGILSKMNTRDYIIQHVKALDGIDVSFDSTSNEALTSGTVSLSNYKAVIWILGREKNASTFDAAERALVEKYLAGGGRLFVSGAEIAADLSSQPDAKAFLTGSLHAALRADNAFSHRVDGAPGGIFEGLSGITFDDGTGKVYNVDSPDAITPVGDARTALVYTGANTAEPQTAAIQYAGAGRLVYTAFPFETINDASTRREMMRRIVKFLME